MTGVQALQAYLDIKKDHPDIDEWLSTSITATFGDAMLDIIQAGSVCYTTLEPWETPLAFEKVVIVLNGRMVLGDISQDIDIREIFYAVKVLKATFPDKQFNDYVTKFIAAIAVNDGYAVLPELLSFVQPFLPVKKLTAAQEKIQQMYLSECYSYAALLEG